MARRRHRKRPPAGPADRALKAFQDGVLFPIGEFIEPSHFKEELADEDLDETDIDRLAYTGRIRRHPQWNRKYQEWRWRQVRGVTVFRLRGR